MCLAFIFVLILPLSQCFFDIQDIMSGTMNRLPRDFSMAIKDIAEGLPAKTITVVRGGSTNISSEDMHRLFCLLSEHGVQVINLDISTKENKEKVATAHLLHHLSLVNWWSGRLYKSPVLPPADKVYCDFKGRVLKVPVLHKADFFLGDVSVTWEGLQAVEFSFLTLADSGAFLTHAPAKLSETLAIIRPFQWEVWPLVAATLLMTGPALWAVIAAPSLWQKGHKNQLALFYNCCWFTTSLFLRQSSSKEPSSTHKARLVAVLISLGATYVIGDMYSANLTSLLARPAREPPIGTLPALEEAMKNRGIMSLFEAGIIAKMTMDEYKNLPEHSRRSDPVSESEQDSSEPKESSGTTSQV
ncbi:hypothetical protein MSG28_007419 [Choristoneura fumiferana]|uniref:Uncharacterized protein n=1 Tax=Choristoneura fumiferana TaxID=7141 RepID=A0ACC0JWY3_CHOFU|nr:hypothetical protein MSG28_007419 [Choristoneura fumiferana]